MRTDAAHVPVSASFFLRALMDAAPHLLDAAGIHPDRRFDAVFVERHASRFIHDVREVSRRAIGDVDVELVVDLAVDLALDPSGTHLAPGHAWSSHADDSLAPAAPRSDLADLGRESERWRPFADRPNEELASLCYSDDSCDLAVLSVAHRLAVLELATGRTRIETLTVDVDVATYSPSRAYLMVRDAWSDDLVVLRDGDPRRVVEGLDRPLFCATFVGDDGLAYVRGDALVLRDLLRGAERVVVTDPRIAGVSVHGLHASPDGRLVAFANDDGIGLVDCATGRVIDHVRAPRDVVRSPRFRADGRELAAIVGSEVVRFALGVASDESARPRQGYAAPLEPVPLLVDIDAYDAVAAVTPLALHDAWSRVRALANEGLAPRRVNPARAAPRPPRHHPRFVALLALLERTFGEVPEVVAQRWLPLLRERIARWAIESPPSFECDAATWALRPVDDLSLPSGSEWSASPPELTCAQLVAARSPVLGLARNVSLDSRALDLRELAWLTRALEAPQLEGLDLTATSLGVDGAQLLAEASFRPRLRYLGLGSNPLGDAGLDALLRQPWPSLVVLDLGDCHLRTVERLIDAAALPALRSLRLSHNPIGDGGVARLATGLRVPLTDLSIGAVAMTDRGLADLGHSAALGALRALHLRMNDHTDRGLFALATSPHLRDLEHLEVTNYVCTAAGIDALLAAPGLLGPVARADLEALRKVLLASG